MSLGVCRKCGAHNFDTDVCEDCNQYEEPTMDMVMGQYERETEYYLSAVRGERRGRYQ